MEEILKIIEKAEEDMKAWDKRKLSDFALICQNTQAFQKIRNIIERERQS